MPLLVIYIAVMVVYQGCSLRSRLQLSPIPGLTIVASPLISTPARLQSERRTQALLIESLNGVQTIRLRVLKIRCWQWQRRYSSFMSESFRSLKIGVSRHGRWLPQSAHRLTLWSVRIW